MGTVEYCKLTKYFWYELLGHNNESNKLSDLNNFNQADEDEGIEGSINENEETTTILVLYFHIDNEFIINPLFSFFKINKFTWNQEPEPVIIKPTIVL